MANRGGMGRNKSSRNIGRSRRGTGDGMSDDARRVWRSVRRCCGTGLILFGRFSASILVLCSNCPAGLELGGSRGSVRTRECTAPRVYGCGGGEAMAPASVSCEGDEPLGGYENPWVSVLRGSAVVEDPTAHDSEERVVPFGGLRNMREYLDVIYKPAGAGMEWLLNTVLTHACSVFVKIPSSLLSDDAA